MTVEEWRELQRTSPDVKYEYLNGRVYAMTGGTLDHGRIGINVCSILTEKLAEKGSPCRVYNSDVAVRLSPTHYTLPDATVTCNERDRGRNLEIQNPCVIVEVLSNSTEARDRGEKFRRSREHPAVQEYVLVSTKYQRSNSIDAAQKGGYCMSLDQVIPLSLRVLGLAFPLPHCTNTPMCQKTSTSQRANYNQGTGFQPIPSRSKAVL
jgi:Uma2 family endonuclease